MRYLSGRDVTLSHTFYDDEDTITVPSVSVSVYVDGDTSPVSTTSGVAAGDGWAVTLTGLAVGAYTAVWTATGYTDSTAFEVVSGFLFTPQEVRAHDKDLASTTKYPPATIRQVREQIEAEFEQITGRSFTSRVRTVRLEASGTTSVWLGVFDVQTLLSVSLNGVAVDDLSAYSVTASGFLEAPAELPVGTVVTACVLYGFATPPDDVKWAALNRCRHLLVARNSGIPDRAVQFIADNGGQFTLATAGAKGWETGIPDVDAILKRYRYDVLYSVGVIP